MTYRDVLTPIDKPEEVRACTRLAAGLAARFGAHLIGVFLKAGIPAGVMAYAGVDGAPIGIDAIIAAQQEEVEKIARESRVLFEQLTQAAAVTNEWRAIDGDLPGDLVGYARRTDLTIFPRKLVPSLGTREFTAQELAAAAGGPILVPLPETAAAGLGKRVLVAWNGSLEASRAVRLAWPFLTGADEVHVLMVTEEGGALAEGLIEHLERHNCRPGLVTDRRGDARAGEAIRDHARSLDIDLVVMGLSSRGRLLELVLGGATRELLRDPPTPLLMAH